MIPLLDKPNHIYKKQNGEVFTPLMVIEDMLHNLDVHYHDQYKQSIFSKKKLKWFDPAVGNGRFMIVLFHRLMSGLSSVIKDEELRRKHIIEEMLYMSELRKENITKCRQLFYGDKYKTNIYHGNTLKLNPVEEWNIETFDIVLGNPPYNHRGIRSSSGSMLGSKNKTIWPEFVTYACKVLRKNGYLVYITPVSWLHKKHITHNILEKHIVWLKLWDVFMAKQNMKGEIPVSIYVLHNVQNIEKRKTEIISELKNAKIFMRERYYLDKNKSLPLAYFSIFDKLSYFIRVHNIPLKIHAKTTRSTHSTTKIQIPDTYTINDKLSVETYTKKEGVLVRVTDKVHPDANKTKIIIANKSGFEGSFIDYGKLGLVGTDKYYILGNNLHVILRLFSFTISYVVCQCTKYRQDFLNKLAFDFIPDIRKMNNHNVTEHQFYSLIGLNKKEIDQLKRLKKRQYTMKKKHMNGKKTKKEYINN